MTQLESASLMNDFEFRGRIKVCVLQYANYILDEAPSVPAHNTRSKWAANTMISPDSVAQQMHAPVVMDAAVQSAGKDITDAALQSAVENVVNDLM